MLSRGSVSARDPCVGIYIGLVIDGVLCGDIFLRFDLALCGSWCRAWFCVRYWSSEWFLPL